MNFSELKENAKKSLKGKYSDVIIMYVVVALISAAVGCVCGFLDYSLGFQSTQRIVFGNYSFVQYNAGLLTSIGTLIVTSLFTFGIIDTFVKISRNEDVTWKNVFSKTNLFISFIVLSFLVSLFVTLWTLLLIIPGIIAAFSYTLVYYVKLDNPEIGYLDAIKKSKELMKGHKWEYFLLNLSFIGWILLVPFTLGILAFWLVPYISVTQCNFYNRIIKK